jgi:nucleoside diphosphate kinase
MVTLGQLFEKQAIGLTVYSPDCTQSRLWGNLDHAIHEASGFQPIYRRWINHDFNSIMRFYSSEGEETPPEQDAEEAARKYENIPPETLQYGHLVPRLFMAGPSLLTIWQGTDVIPTLLTLKGVTHPAEAQPHTIRGRFWCDNAVCNLIHTSDSEAEAERELRALGLLPLLDETASPLPLMEKRPTPPDYVAHSGIWLVCDVVNRMLAEMHNAPRISVLLPLSGDAKETHQNLLTALQNTMQAHAPLAAFITAYLAGDVVTVSQMMKQMPVTKWESFMIQCGAITRDKWS